MCVLSVTLEELHYVIDGPLKARQNIRNDSISKVPTGLLTLPESPYNIEVI